MRVLCVWNPVVPISASSVPKCFVRHDIQWCQHTGIYTEDMLRAFFC